MQQAKVAVGTMSQLAKTSILGRYKIKWDFVPLDPPTFIESWDIVPTFVVYRKPRHSGGVENSLSDEQNSLMC